MTTLTQSQIKLYAAAAGFTNPSLMAAIAMAESSGRTDVVNSIGCVGLWQINQPVHVHEHPSWTQAWLKDPAHNAAAAKVIYDAQGLSAWEAYTNGAYKQYYSGTSGSSTAIQAGYPGQGLVDGTGHLIGGLIDGTGHLIDGIPGVGAVAGTVTDVGNGVASIAKGVWDAGKWLSTPFNWVRIAYVIGGGILTVVAVNMVIQSTVLKKVTGGGSVADTAISLVPGGSAVQKAVKAKSATKAAAAKKAAAAPAKKTTAAPAKKAAAPAKKKTEPAPQGSGS